MAKKALIQKWSKQPKFKTRSYNRCKICGRPHGYIRKFDMCRICFRVFFFWGWGFFSRRHCGIMLIIFRREVVGYYGNEQIEDHA